MRAGLPSFLLLSLSTGFISGCHARAAPSSEANGITTGLTAARDARVQDGQAGTYGRICGYCHGVNVGPKILGRGLPSEAIVAMVRIGPGAMPAFRPTEISNAELDALARWISVSKADPDEHGK